MKALTALFLIAGLFAGEWAQAQSFSQASVDVNTLEKGNPEGEIVRIRMSKPAVIQGLILEGKTGSVRAIMVRLHRSGSTPVELEIRTGYLSTGNFAESPNLSEHGLIESLDVMVASANPSVGTLSLNLVSQEADLVLEAHPELSCLEGLCVGQDIYRVLPGDTRAARVVAIQSNGLFVLEHADGSGTSGNWPRTAVAVKTGCGRSFCVGNDFIYNGQDGARAVRIAAIQGDGKYVMYFFDVQDVAGNWSENEVRALQRPRSAPARRVPGRGLY